jgi:hypothetical protein
MREFEEYSEVISLPAWRAARASAWALLELQRLYGKLGSAHVVELSHTMA